jgi:hypothetical protein
VFIVLIGAKSRRGEGRGSVPVHAIIGLPLRAKNMLAVGTCPAFVNIIGNRFAAVRALAVGITGLDWVGLRVNARLIGGMGRSAVRAVVNGILPRPVNVIGDNITRRVPRFDFFVHHGDTVSKGGGFVKKKISGTARYF